MAVSVVANNDIREALLDYYQGIAAIVAELDSAAEIKEIWYQSEEFKYPGIRLGNFVQVPDINNCEKSYLTFSVYIMDENNSSKNCDTISHLVATNSHKTSFSQNSLKFTGMRVTRYPSPIRSDEDTWTNQVDIAVASVSPLV